MPVKLANTHKVKFRISQVMDTGKNRKKEEKSKFNVGYFASVLVSLKLDSYTLQLFPRHKQRLYNNGLESSHE